VTEHLEIRNHPLGDAVVRVPPLVVSDEEAWARYWRIPFLPELTGSHRGLSFDEWQTVLRNMLKLPDPAGIGFEPIASFSPPVTH